MISDQKTIIRLGVTDLSFHRVAGSLVANILTRLGFTVVREYALHEENFAKLKAGKIDMVASAWLPFSHGIYKEDVEKTQSTRELGLHYQPYALWGVPDYVPESSVSEITDLLKPEVKNQTELIIQGIGMGAGITRFSIEMMKQYGLTNAGYEFRTGTQDDCIRAFETAVKQKKWVVVPLWQPQFLHAQYQIRELKERKGLLGGQDRAVLLVREEFLQEKLNPSAVQVLDRIKLSNSIISKLDYEVNRLSKNDDVAVAEWIDRNHSLVADWMAV